MIFHYTYSLPAFLVIVVVSTAVCFKQRHYLKLIDNISTLSFYLSLAFSLGWTFYRLQRVTDPSQIGITVGFSLALLLYAAILKIIAISIKTLKTAT